MNPATCHSFCGDLALGVGECAQSMRTTVHRAKLQPRREVRRGQLYRQCCSIGTTATRAFRRISNNGKRTVLFVLNSRLQTFKNCIWSAGTHLTLSFSLSAPEMQVPNPLFGDSMRFYPHLQDTGGFFVAVIEKVKPMPVLDKQRLQNIQQAVPSDAMDAEMTPPLQTADDAKASEGMKAPKAQSKHTLPASRRQQRPGKTTEDPFLPLTGEPGKALEHIRDYYGIGPSLDASQLMVRTEKAKNIYLIGKGLANILWCDQRGFTKVCFVDRPCSACPSHPPTSLSMWACVHSPSRRRGAALVCTDWCKKPFHTCSHMSQKGR